ncbi:MAG: ABC transporter permease [Defluviitaleaceae bacterium]|nr:ABC transporter permease [Defluviitaleaceae bacterium]
MAQILLTISITLMYAAPLILAGMGGVISEKSGVVNLALEGIMTVGAFAGAAVAFSTGNVWLGFGAAGLAGAGLASLHAIATVIFKADQTISGIALNFVGPGMAVFFSRLMFGAVRSNPVPSYAQMPRFSIGEDSVFSVNFTVIIAFLLVAGLFVFLYRTKWGLRVIAIGEHPAAADTLGVNVNLTRFMCVLASGVFAGFGGAAFTLSIVSIFAPNIIAGSGFIALAAVIFGKWTPHGTLGACLVFGLFQALTIVLRQYDLPVPLQVITMMPYIVTLIVLVLFVGKSVAPKAVGIPYVKGSS